ncbi:hypothetical protein AWM75_05025 [Aerococcus urinaehominis]|uniref:Uncharacterized protein n=1 Tax=Aerococcus urinaehominis TaxID=128944 RepID=A0A0X8FL87_9LACT|nr:energy-coupling factor transporter transmembrane component T [Aerococcus urinaehominis]AMB99393.1 hypothetical protein AWM75_05025 [Aerococcus urinaehominis]SDM23631.1 energy-coupling factor transport system permease protein [Aerococcus urinaehominis]
MNNSIVGYQAKDTPIHRLNALAKLIFFILVSLALMLTYDTRLLLGVSLFLMGGLYLADIKWRDVAFFIKIVAVFSVINLVMVYIFSPEYGVDLYGSRTIIWEGIGPYTLTWEQLFYQINLVLKYFSTIPLVLLFLMTVNPSEVASSLNRIGLSYRLSYAVSLTLRYIPDIQRDYIAIRDSQRARGQGRKDQAGLMDKAKVATKTIMPLIMTSFAQIETVSHAMMLRRFGGKHKRTWYVAKPLKSKDYLLILAGLLVFLLFVYFYYVNQGRFYNPFRG